jgi:hypothetical protein
VERLCREAVFAGCSYGKTGKYKGDYVQYDFNRLYPYVMQQCIFPGGKPVYAKERKEDRLGVYRCTITKLPDCELSPVPVRRNDALVWKTAIMESSWETTMTTVDMDLWESKGGQLQVHGGVFWKHTCEPFARYMGKLMTASNNQPFNTAKKLLRNSIFGKMLEKRKITTCEIVKHEDFDPTDFSPKQLDGMKQVVQGKEGRVLYHLPTTEEESSSTAHWGAFILSYARQKLREAVDAVGEENVYIIETDSIVVPKNKAGDLEHLIGGQPGELKIEFEASEVMCLRKKAYALANAKETKVRWAGISGDDKVLWRKMGETLDTGTCTIDVPVTARHLEHGLLVCYKGTRRVNVKI